MIDTIELQEIKIKFARLISRLYTDAKFSIENINDILIKSDLLDCFEYNQPNLFLNMTFEEISEKLGAGKIKFYEDLNEELYWAGLQYMNIFLNKMIPLKQLLVAIPIYSMIEKFKIYHEMNDIEMLKVYDGFSEISMLKSLRKQSGHSIRELSFITGIPENSLKRYEKSNNYLLNASFENIYSLSRFFRVDASLFRKKTTFIPYVESLWSDQNFISELKRQLCCAFKIKEDDTLLIREADDIKEKLIESARIIVVEPISFLYTAYSDRVLKKHLDEVIVYKAIYESIRYAIDNYDGINAYF